MGSTQLRPLNKPRPVRVQTDEGGFPVALFFSGRRLVVDERLESWRIDDEWWRPKPIARIYHRLLLEDGRVVDVYRDLSNGKWHQQAY